MNILSRLLKTFLGLFSGSGKGGSDVRLSQRRKALRAAGDAIDFVKDKMSELQADRDAKWKEAAGYLKNGQKPAARQALALVRDCDVKLTLLDRRRWLFESIVMKLESVEPDRAFAEALSALAKVVSVDPELTAQALGEAAEKCDVLKEVEKAWNRQYAREMNGFGGGAAVPSVEDMMKDLEGSLANEKPAKPANKAEGQSGEKKPSEKPSEKATTANIAEILRNIAKAMGGSGK